MHFLRPTEEQQQRLLDTINALPAFWERSKNMNGPWQRVRRVPPTVLRKYTKRQARGETDLVIPAYSYYYRHTL